MAANSLSNHEIAELIRHVAAVYSTQGDVNPFRIKAYDAAANSIDQTSTPLFELWQDKQLETVPGLGKTIIGHLEEIFTTGKATHFETVLKEVPAGFFPLVDLPGIGPKMAIKLASTLSLTDGATALSKVKEAATLGKLNGLPGISTVMEKKILDIVSQPKSDLPHRNLLYSSLEIAETLKTYLLLSSAISQCEVLGSLRRRLPTTGDVDLAVCASDAGVVIEHLHKYPLFTKAISSGEKTLAIYLKGGIRVDLKLSTPEQWGSLLQHYTGSKLHNIHLRTIALEKGMSLSEFGIKKDGELQNYADEKTFYHALGMDWIPPELRENVGEIEAAIAQKLPHLLELEDIRGDIHMHTNLDFPTSHDMGASSIAELLAKAEELKYSFIGFSDHNPKRSGLDEKGRFEAVKKRNEQIDEEVQKYFGKREPTLKVFKGLEVDILTTGELALEDEALELLDYAIVSVHSSFANDRETNTQRILKGLAHPKVKVLGHPTGRLIEKRKGLEADWEKIAQFCADSGKFLEINSAPDRLDFPYDMVKNVKKTGVKFFINTDSHHVAGLDLMKFGVWTARKGWLTKKDVVNTDENFLSGR